MNNRRFQRAAALLPVLLMLIFPAGCAEKGVSRSLLAMDTAMVLTLYGGRAEEAADASVAEILRLERLFSASDPDSELSKINREAGHFVPVGTDTSEILLAAKEAGEATGGAFDITVRPLVEAWGFISREYRIPEQAEIDGMLCTVGFGGVETADGEARIGEGQKIDLGGIAKGYLTDRLFAILTEHGVRRGTVSLGGNVLAFGARADGGGWRIGLENPDAPGDSYGVLTLRDTAVITSGSYQRCFEEDGRRYHHIIDPKTGRPSESGLLAVTVVSDDGTRADALSTALFVMGKEAAFRFWKETGGFEMVLVGEDGVVSVTEGLRDAFILLDTGYTLEFLA